MGVKTTLVEHGVSPEEFERSDYREMAEIARRIRERENARTELFAEGVKALIAAVTGVAGTGGRGPSTMDVE